MEIDFTDAKKEYKRNQDKILQRISVVEGVDHITLHHLSPTDSSSPSQAKEQKMNKKNRLTSDDSDNSISAAPTINQNIIQQWETKNEQTKNDISNLEKSVHEVTKTCKNIQTELSQSYTSENNEEKEKLSKITKDFSDIQTSKLIRLKIKSRI